MEINQINTGDSGGLAGNRPVTENRNAALQNEEKQWALQEGPRSAETGAVQEQKGDILNALLMEYGVKLTPENRQLLEQLLSHKMPMDKSTFQRLNQYVKILELVWGEIEENGQATGSSLDKGVFFLKNELTPNEITMDALKYLLSAEGSPIEKGMEQLLNTMDALPEGSLKSGLQELFSNEFQGGAAGFETVSFISEDSGSGILTGKPDELLKLCLKIAGEVLEEEKLLPREPVKLLEGPLPAHLKEERPPDLAQALEQFIRQRTAPDLTGAKVDLKEMAELIFKKESNPAIKKEFTAQFVEIVKANVGNKSLKPGNKNSYRIMLEKDGQEEISKKLDALREQMAKTMKLTEDNPQAVKVHTQAAQLKHVLEFAGQLKECVYIPLPLTYKERHGEGELYVFKDGGRRNKGHNGRQSALVALNTVNLGRVETYIQKLGAHLYLQFRHDQPDAGKSLRLGSKQLAAMLQSKGYSIKKLSVIPLETPFTILSAEEDLSEGGAGKDITALGIDKRA